MLEVCVTTPEGACAAAEGGAGRVELCSALGEGGVTPSWGLMRQVRQVPGLRMHVLIRPRGGDFVYSRAEVECMIDDIKAAAECGVDGVVTGALLPTGDIDMDVCRRLVEAAAGMSVTFHRAFDLCRDPFKALDDIMALGCDRLLTSGCASSALAGSGLIADLRIRAAGRLTLLPGGGVNPGNAAEIMRLTGCRELHASARSSLASVMTYRRDGVAMGAPGSDEYCRLETSAEIVRGIVKAMNDNVV